MFIATGTSHKFTLVGGNLNLNISNVNLTSVLTIQCCLVQLYIHDYIFFLFQIYNGTNLLAISSGGEIKKYALKIFKVLFTEEEMVQGMVGPIQRAKTGGKVLLDESRVSLLKREYNIFFV